MDKQKAYEILVTATSSLKLTRDGHQLVEKALLTLKPEKTIKEIVNDRLDPENSQVVPPSNPSGDTVPKAE